MSRHIVKPIAVDIAGAAAMISLSISTIEALERAGDFPRKRQLSGRRCGYLVAEIEAWAEARPLSDLPPPKNAGKNAGRYQQKADRS